MTEELITSIVPNNKFILFSFPDGVWNDTVTEKTSWGFEFQDSTAHTVQPPRWVLVHAVGPEVNAQADEASQITPGSTILVEALMWTQFQEYEGRKIWWTSVDKVLGIKPAEQAA